MFGQNSHFPSAPRQGALASSVADISARLVRDASPLISVQRAKQRGCAAGSRKSHRPAVDPRPPRQVDAGLHRLTSADAQRLKSENDKTNPITPTAGVHPRALAIARLLAQGKSLVEIARHLGITRQAVWRWSRRPDVIHEVHRAHALLLYVGGTAREQKSTLTRADAG